MLMQIIDFEIITFLFIGRFVNEHQIVTNPACLIRCIHQTNLRECILLLVDISW